MAITNSDGSITLTTKVDESGLNKGITSIKSRVNTASAGLSKLGRAVSAALGVSAISNFSRQAGEMASEQEANIQRLIDIYGQASKEVSNFINKNSMALGMSRSAASEFSAVYGNLFSVWADQATNAELTNRYLNMTAVVASKTGRTVQDVQERIRSGLLGNTEAIEDLGVFVNVKTIEMTDAFQRMANGRSWEQLDAYTQQQVRTMAILEQATQKYGETVANTSSLTRAQFRAAYEDLKATWGQFVNVVLMPILRAITVIMTVMAEGLRNVARIFGFSLEMTDSISSSIGNAVSSQNELTGAVKDTNEELKKTLASFDEIEILSANMAETGSDIVGSTIFPDIEEAERDDQQAGNAIDNFIQSNIRLIRGAGAGMVVVGVLLMLLAGKFWLGLTLTAIGAAMLFTERQSDFEKSKNIINEFIENNKELIKDVSAALLVIGVLLTLVSGRFWLGLTLIGIGVAGYYTAAGEDFGAAMSKINEWVAANKRFVIVASLGLALVGLVLLLGAGGFWLGLTLLAGGLATYHEVAQPDYAETKNKIIEWIAANNEFVLVAGVAMAIIGLLIMSISGKFMLGLSLVAAGMGALYTVYSESPEETKRKINEWIETNKDEILLAGAALILLGVLLFSVNFMLGVMIVSAGAGMLYHILTTDDETAQKIQGWVEEYKEEIEDVSMALILIGVLLIITGAGFMSGIGLVAMGAGMMTFLADQEGTNLETLIENWVNENWRALEVSGAALITIGMLLVASGVGTAAGLAMVAAGAAMLYGMGTAGNDEYDPGYPSIQEYLAAGNSEVAANAFRILQTAEPGSPLHDVATLYLSHYSKMQSAIDEYEAPESVPLPPEGAPLPWGIGSNPIELPPEMRYGTGANSIHPNSVQQSTVILEVDGREFGRAVVETGGVETRRVGTSLVTG